MSYDTYRSINNFNRGKMTLLLDDQFSSFVYSPPLRRKGLSPRGLSPRGTLGQRKNKTKLGETGHQRRG